MRGLQKTPPFTFVLRVSRNRPCNKGAQENTPLQISLQGESKLPTRWVIWLGLAIASFGVLETHSVRSGTPTLSTAFRMWTKHPAAAAGFVAFWVWWIGHVVLKWPVPAEEVLCRRIKGSVQAAAARDGDG